MPLGDGLGVGLGVPLGDGLGLGLGVGVAPGLPDILIVMVPQPPIDVIVMLVAVLSTVKYLPANNSALVAVLGDTVPTFAVMAKSGPVLAPNPELSLTNTCIYYKYFLSLTLVSIKC